MKKLIVAFVAFALLFIAGCASKDQIDVNAILEVDSGQLSVEAEANHKHLISNDPNLISADGIQKNVSLTIINTKCNLIHQDSWHFPVGDEVLHRYFVDGDESKTILIDQKGNINSILYKYTKLNIGPTDTHEDVLEPLKEELAKTVDISHYANVRMTASTPLSDGYWICDYIFYNTNNGYQTDSLIVSVTNDGSVFALKIFHLGIDDLKVNIDKDKENAAIELKLKDIYNTNITKYQSYSMEYDPCIVQYNNQPYVEYWVSANYLHTQWEEMKSSPIIQLLVPLNTLCN